MGRYWYYPLGVLLLGSLVLIGHVVSREIETSRREVTGEGEEDTLAQTLAEALQLVCQHTVDAFFEDAQPLHADRELRERYSDFIQEVGEQPGEFFLPKPITTHSKSVCSGLNATCCTPRAEKNLQKVVSKEYREVFHAVLRDEYFLTCPHTGRESYHVLRRSFIEAKRQLSIEVNDVLNGTLHPGAFDQLFDYFAQFSITPDLCHLRGLVRSQVEGILISAFLHMETVHDGDSEYNRETINPKYLACLKNISQPYVSDYTNEISATIGKLFADFKVYVTSLKLAQKVITTVRNYQFTPACLTALTRIKHCSYCGGYKLFKPCLNLCLNTLRGCFSDVAELDESFKNFTVLFKTLSKELDSELQPEAFVANQMRRFVTIVEEVKHQSSLEYLMRSECAQYQQIVSEEGTTSHQRSRRSRFFQPIKTGSDSEEQSGTSFNPNTDLSDFSIAKTFVYEVDCLEAFEKLLTSIPQEMCYLGKSLPITNALNTRCWTGYSLGNYDEPLAGILKSQQANNTAFVAQPMDLDIQYTHLISELQIKAHNIKQVLEFREQCSQSDDEDCIRHYVNEDECEHYSSTGSTSGSGSASGSGDPSSGMVDMEGAPRPSKGNKTSSLGKTDNEKANEPSSEEFSQYWPLNDAPTTNNSNSTSSGSGNDKETPTDEDIVTIGRIDITQPDPVSDETETEEARVTIKTEGTHSELDHTTTTNFATEMDTEKSRTGTSIDVGLGGQSGALSIRQMATTCLIIVVSASLSTLTTP